MRLNFDQILLLLYAPPPITLSLKNASFLLTPPFLILFKDAGRTLFTDSSLPQVPELRYGTEKFSLQICLASVLI